MTNTFDLQCQDGLEYLKTISNNSIDLILTDPPYIISKDTGMNKHYNSVKNKTIKYIKTKKEWNDYKEKIDSKDYKDDIDMKTAEENYRMYGSIYGKKYCVKTDYGNWDKDFTMEIMEEYIKQYYKKLKDGGTLIIWFDLWKITTLKELMEKYKFKQIRMIEWIKTNPQPLNSKINYLTNCREIALVGIKKSKPTFNSKYDNGIYNYPLEGKNRFHPTQKSLDLFKELILKHSNEGEIVLDTFSGSGTTMRACKYTKRSFRGSELNQEYIDRTLELMNKIEN